MEITNKDIGRVEKLFFPDGGDFKDEKNERYNFIKCVDRSIDVHACPGSGKTTSLLAKLYLLSEKMPFPNGRAICVLTHTNVAIDTIKDRLGTKANRLFQYPNFFGTIQSYVDRYLAIPYYSKLTGNRIQQIDTVAQRRRMNNTYWLGRQFKVGLNNWRSYNYIADLFGNYSVIENEKGENILINSETKNEIILRKPRSRRDWSSEEKERIIEAAVELKEKVLYEDRILSFYDAYELASIYLKEYPNLKSLFSSRFGYVFIDEMQDTHAHQLEILNDLFDDSVIIQRIGDLNQAILGETESNTVWQKEREHLKITGSRRFSQPIANVLRSVALDPEDDLTGLNRAELSPHIITYDEDDRNTVLEKFIDLINRYKLINKSKETGYPFKAVGWIGKEKDGLTIGDYFDAYNKDLSKNKSSYPNIITLLACSLEATPKEFRDNIFNGLLEVLFLENVYRKDSDQKRRHSKTSLIKLIEEKSEELYSSFLTLISGLYFKRTESKLEDLHTEFQNYLLNEIFESLNIEVKKNGKDYITETEIKEVTPDQLNKFNIYRSSKPDLKHIDIHIGTVHSVKGETHTATLYLETKYYKNCGNHLINELTGNPYNGNGGIRKEKCLKVAHVGFSRPTDLLCIALDRSLVEDNRDDLKAFNWKIIE